MAERPESSDHPIILIVEDSDSQRYLWGRRFAGEHCRILEASTGSEALQLATDSDPDIVILDVQLPDRSGMEICRTLKGTPATSAIPVMLVSQVFQSAEDRVTGVACGADAYLTGEEPVEVMLATARALVRLRLMNRELQRSEFRLRALETAHRTAEHKFMVAAELGTDLIWECNLDSGEIQYFGRLAQPSNRFARDLPQSLEGWLSRIHGNDRARVAEEFEHHLADGGDFDEMYAFSIAGEERYWRHRAILLRGCGGVRKWIAAVRDVTERRLTLQRLQISEERFRLVAESATDIVWERDLKTGRITWLSGRDSLLLGGVSEVNLIDDYYTRVHPADAARIEAALNQHVKTGEPYRTTYRFRVPDGTYHMVFSRAHAIRNDKGEAHRLIGALIDLTEASMGEGALSQMAAIVEQSGDAIVVKSPDGLVVSWNAGAERLFGYRSDEMIGRHIGILVPEGRREEEEKLLTAVRAGGLISPYDSERVCRSGDVVPVSIVASPIKDRAGRVIGISTIARDVTEQKNNRLAMERMNEDLRRLSGELLRAEDEARRQIARDLHDGVAQTFAAVCMNLSALEQSPSLQGDDDAAHRIADSIELAKEGSRELRTLSYLLHPPLLDELGLSSALKNFVEGFTRRTGIAVALDLDELGRLSPEAEIAVFRIVQESLSNAQRHGVATRIGIRAKRRGERLELEIEDNGRGIKGGWPWREKSGVLFGVGIPGMKERARRLGGDLDIESVPGRTVVRVTLPMGLQK